MCCGLAFFHHLVLALALADPAAAAISDDPRGQEGGGGEHRGKRQWQQATREAAASVDKRGNRG